MRFSWAKVLVSFLAVLALVGVPAQAQLTTGTISGTVVDPTGAVIPGATVTLTHVATGVTREMESGGAGGFVFDRVRGGTYTLRISKAGFRTWESTDVEVTVGRVTALGTLALEVGAAAETVTVEAGAVPLMQSESPQIVGEYPARVVSEVNWGIFGLDATAFMTAGILPSFGNINTNTGGFGAQIGGDAGAVPTSAGLRGRSTQFSMDGHENNDISIGGPSIFLINQDTVAEYQVTTNTFDASQGRMPGAQVNVLTKSGTNDIHGSLFYFYRANSLRAKTSSESRFDLEKPKSIRQDFGFTAGGPVIKNRWFVFGSYYHYDLPGAFTDDSSGTFALTNAGANALAAAFPGNAAVAIYRDRGPFTIPDGNPACLNPAVNINFSAAGGPAAVEACEVVRTVPDQETLTEYSLRFDFVANKQTFSGKYYDQLNPFCCSGGTSGYWVGVPSRTQSFSFGHTFQFTPRILNDFRFNFGRFIVAFEGANTEPIGNIRGNLANFSFFNLTNSRHGVVGSLHGFGLATNLPQNRLLYNFQYADNVSLIRGRHTIKAGMEVRRNRTTVVFLPFVNGAFTFNSDTSFLTNVPTSTLFTEGPIAFQPFETDQFYFVQDDFRIRPNLILNVGIRYENTGQPVNTIFEFQRERETSVSAFWLQSLPLEQRIFNKVDRDDNNWGPRIGFAYTPRWGKRIFGEDQTVIRGGYSISYEAAFYNILLNINTSAPQVFSFSVAGFPVTGGATGSEVAASIPTPRNTFDPRQFFRTNVACGRSPFTCDETFASPYVENWSLGIQRQLGSRLVAEARYVGNRMIGGYQSVNANPQFSNLLASFPGTVPSGITPCPASAAPATFTSATSLNRVFCDSGPVRSRINSARSNHHSLQTRLDFRNLFNQLTGGVNFTWGKTIDNNSEIFNFTEGGSRAFSENPFDYVDGERGLSNHHLGRAFTAFWIWDSPWYREQQGAVGKVLGGWQWNTQLFLYDGRPWTAVQSSSPGLQPFCGQDTTFNSSFVGALGTCRAISADPSAPMETVGVFGTPGVRWWFNDTSACSLTACPAGTPFGAGRNNEFGDGTVVANMGFFKNTRVGPEGRINVQFRTMAVNIFNHRNFGPPNSLFTRSANFGRPNRNDAAGRIIRFALRVTF